MEVNTRNTVFQVFCTGAHEKMKERKIVRDEWKKNINISHPKLIHITVSIP
jgi:hypothetical protein